MKKIIASAIIIPIILSLLIFRVQLLSAASGFYLYSPCDTPIQYSIGTIDDGFSTTKEQLLEDAKKASKIWSDTQGKQLFAYNPESKFTINMVYDDRQALTSQITEMNGNLKEKQSQIDPQIEDFKKRQVEFEKKVTDLNSQIQYWNEHGGAPKEEYEKLLTRQEELKKEAAALNADARSLGQSTEEYNQNAKKLNNTIDTYEQVLENKPEEGLYEQEGSKKSISIYIDISHDEFLHTLTHEMGHALGLDHNSGKESIMYPQTTKILVPSNKDIEALNQICMKRPLHEVFLNRASEVMQVLQKRFQVSTN